MLHSCERCHRLRTTLAAAPADAGVVLEIGRWRVRQASPSALSSEFSEYYDFPETDRLFIFDQLKKWLW